MTSHATIAQTLKPITQSVQAAFLVRITAAAGQRLRSVAQSVSGAVTAALVKIVNMAAVRSVYSEAGDWRDTLYVLGSDGNLYACQAATNPYGGPLVCTPLKVTFLPVPV